MPSSDSIRTPLVYAASVVLLTYYGIEVCPYLESLSMGELALTLGVAFALGFVARRALLERVRRGPGADLPYRHLLVDLSIWTAVGLATTAWNLVVHDFPVGSGIKLTLGCLTLGIFSAAYLALDVERRVVDRLAASGTPVGIRPGSFFSISTRFLVFSIASMVVISVVLLLLLTRDLVVVRDSVARGDGIPFEPMVREVVLVFAFLVVSTSIVARNYSRNLHRMFELQLRAFQSVERGDYDAFVPVVTNDEFGLIAEKTNRMILGLREKERIKKAFGKYLSPMVAESILASDGGTDLGGRLAEVAVLFTDLRNYTPLSERLTPAETVGLLNEYFGLIVEAVHAEGGILDKFIGDAAMAVFGLDDPSTACEKAVRAALQIRRDIAGFNARLLERHGFAIESGTGIHFGPVVAGNIGSTERLEYTVIGDTVNTAARLESLTKELGAPVAISQAVHDRLSPASRAAFAPRGEHSLKGKSGRTIVHALAAPDPTFPG